MINKILVLGASGTQGHPAVKELVKAGFDVYGMVREGSKKAALLEDFDAKPVFGDLFDVESLRSNMVEMDGVLFIPPVTTAVDPIPELTVGLNVLKAAEDAGIQYLIHTSVDRAGDQQSFTGWGKTFGYNMRMYWMAKSDVIDFVKSTTIPYWTVFKPTLLMEDFIPPIVYAQFPTLKDGFITTTIKPDVKMGLVSAQDQAKLIAKAFSEPEKFTHKEIPLASDRLTMGEIAGDISEATGKSVQAICVTPDEFRTNKEVLEAFDKTYGKIADMVMDASLQSFEWDNTDGYTADPIKSNEYGVKLMTFSEWCDKHKNDFDI